MKIFTKKSLAIVAALLLVAVVLLVVCLFKNNKYDIEISNPFTSLAKESTTTLTCEFKESSAFYKEQNKEYIRHIAGVDKNGKPVVLTFVNINSDKPQLDYNVKLENGSEMIDDLLVADRLPASILFVDRIPGGDPAFYTLFTDKKVAVWQQSASQGPQDEIVSSFDSMGFCH